MAGEQACGTLGIEDNGSEKLQGFCSKSKTALTTGHLCHLGLRTKY